MTRADAPAAPDPATASAPGLGDWLAACAVHPGHLDELRPPDAMDNGANSPLSTGLWGQFSDQVGAVSAHQLDQRLASLRRQIRDNGVTYNVYADEDGPQRPWSLDLFPLLVDASSWARIEAGVLQRMRLMERVLADVYGPQQLLARGLLPPALVQGHPGYLRELHGVEPVGGQRLQVAAFDLAHGPDGHWWLLGQRCQAPSGLGYLLENRLAVSAQFPQAFQALRVQRLAGTYRALMQSLRQRSPAGEQAHLALLTPGPYNETYFEHAYLARYLGLTLVEGSDLIVRDERLFLRTLRGLVPIDGLLKRVDDLYLDPLELKSDSTLGVPGLLQALRAGRVLVANMPGSALLESPALQGFLPGLAQHLMGETLSLPALPTWWCGERAAMLEVLARLREGVIKPTYPGAPGQASFEAVPGHALGPREIDEWTGRIVRHGADHTVQAYLPLSQMPTWQAGDRANRAAGRVQARSVLLRVFAVSDPQGGWRVLPGGLARLANPADGVASMQRGGSSADVWAVTGEEVDASTLLTRSAPLAAGAQRIRPVTSRAAENLFWLGRYTERTENTLRLARLTLQCLNGEEVAEEPLTRWLGALAAHHGLLPPGVPAPAQGRRVFERALIAGLDAQDGGGSVGFNLRALRRAASAVRERLSQEHWRMIQRAEQTFSTECPPVRPGADPPVADAVRALSHCSDLMAAITGAQADRMTRDDGWRLLSTGRMIERLGFLSAALAEGLDTGAADHGSGFEAVVSLADSTITCHARYQQSRERQAWVELLVLDPDNPRSLAGVLQALRGRLSRLEARSTGEAGPLVAELPAPSGWSA
ncbi:MAG: A circularly permuted ATPgrasp family protein, partial [Rhodoferax sp.]|nr:A circularly permuted ATPgrasp family protein [Rhodoferax sp.]